MHIPNQREGDEMSERNFRKMLEDRWSEGKFVCVGLDSDIDKIPESVDRNLRGIHLPCDVIVKFNKLIVEATCDLVCAYKPNIAFYEACGSFGFEALRSTIANIHTTAPDIPVILDAKRGDIGNSNEAYVKMAFEYMKADAITVNPYLGLEALKPFFEQADMGIFVLCSTSNPGAGEFQDLPVCDQQLYHYVARNAATKWNMNDNCGLVVGAQNLHALCSVRELVGDMPILIPGIGVQDGDLEKTVKAGKDSRGRGIIINSSRAIIFASNGEDFA